MRDINDIMPKVDNMKWGALMNQPPTSRRIYEMDQIFPSDGRWHTVLEDDTTVTIDGKEVRKNNPDKWT